MAETYKAREESVWEREKPIIDVRNLSEKTVLEAKIVLNGFISQKQIKQFLKEKKESKFVPIIKNLSVENIQEVSLASGEGVDAYSLKVKTLYGKVYEITLLVDNKSETLARSIKKGKEDVILEMLVYRKGEIDYQKLA
ncbi:TPA: hypothetical protein HA243_03290 [Candidatus Micrarchaeota archaeon]|nr:hypothetical protein [Candidatus Micrarchaeota archaeon]